MVGRRQHSNFLRLKHSGPISAVYPYQTLLVPYHAVDAVREALVLRAGMIGRTDPGQAEKLRDLARQLK